MKLINITENKKEPDGTYVGAKISKRSKKALREFCIENKIPNRQRSEKMHTTIIYSRKYDNSLQVSQELYPFTAKIIKAEVFETYNKKNALVARLDCPELVKRHKELMKTYDLTYDYDEYKAHITLSYDCGDFDPESLDFGKLTVEFTEEYMEDLVLDWNDKDE